MKSIRDIEQRKWGCLSLSLLVHGSLGATIALAPMASAKKELPPSVYLQETSTEMPKGEQLETLPPAQQVAAAAPQAEVKPADVAAPTEQKVKPNEIATPKDIPAPLPAKAKPAKQVARALPVKKTTTQAVADEPDLSVKSALEAARNEKTQVENFEEGETLLSTPAIAQQQEEEGLEPSAPVEQNDDSSSSAATTAVVETPAAEEKEEAPPVKKETPEAALAPLQETSQAETNSETTAAATTTATAPQATSTQNTTGTGNGAQNAPAAPYGIRDADSLRQAAGNKNPAYPDRDRLARNQGTAVFIARVTPSGTVTDIQLEKSSNSRTLDASAMEAMKRWRFLPGQEGMVRKAFNFSLNGNAQEIPARLRR